jgi:transcription factor STE12
MAIMDYHTPHYVSFDNHFQSYSAPSSTRSSPPTYDIDLGYPNSLQYTQDHDYHQQMRPQLHPSRNNSYSTQPLQVMTDGPHDHDPADYTAHPSRPHTYQFRINEHQGSSSKPDDDDGSVQSFDRSGEILPNCVGFNRPLNHHEQERIAHLDRLKFFLATAPSRWDQQSDTDALMMTPTDASDPAMPPGHPSSSHPALNRFLLPTSEYVSCVLWNGLYHITGTDIVRALVFRFEAFGRPVRNMKKFEEGIFSDLRNLKPGVDACLEEPKVSIADFDIHFFGPFANYF